MNSIDFYLIELIVYEERSKKTVITTWLVTALIKVYPDALTAKERIDFSTSPSALGTFLRRD